ncbi:MAG TPA: hypothetical protein VK908_03760 [Jiangellales bacterium]|jgi:hypothetical protein|nr:hypothetical protein [Jiangellales bacterium]
MVALDALGLACDLRATPDRYPGPRPGHSGLLRGPCFHRLYVEGVRVLGEARVAAGHCCGSVTEALDVLLAARGLPTTAGRVLVLGVGANASPAVLRAKLVTARVSDVVPMVLARVGSLAVGWSAHLSRRRYVPVTPCRRPGATTSVVGAWLDPDQVAAVDATEPGYRRRRLDLNEHELRLDGGTAAREAWVYVSRYGVIGRAGRAVAARDQRAARTHVPSDAVPGPLSQVETVDHGLALLP